MTAPARIDPFVDTRLGVWHGDGVTVRRSRHTQHGGVGPGNLPNLRAHRRDNRLIVEHHLTPDDLCDELATMIFTDLADIGMLHRQADFEEVFTGIIRSTVDGPENSWLTFYRNSVNRLEAGTAGFSPVHRRAANLILGPEVIDLGCCFGFFPLRLAAMGIDVLATDLSVPTTDLLARMSGLLNRPLRTLACDARCVPLPDRSADTVTAVHLIEHLHPGQSFAVVQEALRLARRRVVIAVPFETEPTACFGHVQRFARSDLHRMALRLESGNPGLRATVEEHHGGWLILDWKPLPECCPSTARA